MVETMISPYFAATQIFWELHEGVCLRSGGVFILDIDDIGSRLRLDWLHPSSFWHSDGAGLVFVSIFGLKAMMAMLLFIIIGCTLHPTKHRPTFMS